MHLAPASTLSPASSAQDAAPSRLGRGQVALLLAWGVLLWIVVALLVRHAPPALFGRGAATALLFAAALPVAPAAVWATRRLASLRPEQLMPGVALASAAAMLCDGIALTWTTLYGPAGADLLPAAAWLLWGVGLILLAAFAAARRDGA